MILVYLNSYTDGVSSGAGPDYPLRVFELIPIFSNKVPLLDIRFSVECFSSTIIFPFDRFHLWSLCGLSFDTRLLITPLTHGSWLPL